MKARNSLIDDNLRFLQQGRELLFLISHTVHHFALIAFMLRSFGIEPGDKFGVAPSTLRYRQDCQA